MAAPRRDLASLAASPLKLLEIAKFGSESLVLTALSVFPVENTGYNLGSLKECWIS